MAFVTVYTVTRPSGDEFVFVAMPNVPISMAWYAASPPQPRPIIVGRSRLAAWGGL